MRVGIVAALALSASLASTGCLGGGFFGGAPHPRDYVSDDDYSRLVVEVDVIEGQAPSSGVLDLLRARLASVVSKPGGVEVRVDDTLEPRGGTWSARDIRDYSEAHQDDSTGGDTVVLHILYLDGEFEQQNALGVTLGTRNPTTTGPIAIFSETLRNACGPLCLSGTDPAMRAVTVHEAGHALGLVNNGIGMRTPHEDGAHPGHSNSRASVMYWEVETTSIFTVFTGGPPTDFDANDRADLCDAGGRC